jgi:hypothetical protein
LEEMGESRSPPANRRDDSVGDEVGLEPKLV